eukprot:356480-Chlamydomonas_euryale.AAC.2
MSSVSCGALPMVSRNSGCRRVTVLQLVNPFIPIRAQGLLPSLSRQLGMPLPAYASVAGQGEWLVEVPVGSERSVPRGWHKVCSTKKVHR